MKKAKLGPHSVIGGNTVAEWDRKWTAVNGGLRAYHPHLRHSIGLWRLRLNGDIVALGSGADKSGGLAKRLSDFRRPGKSGRDHHVGRRIYERRDEVEVEVLIVGSDYQAQKDALKLRRPMIDIHKPLWNASAAAAQRAMIKAMTT